jgi:hypothetical protein
MLTEQFFRVAKVVKDNEFIGKKSLSFLNRSF